MLKEHGWGQPIAISKDGFILAGHARLKAALKNKEKNVPVIRLPLTGKKALAYLIADNKSHEETYWNIPELKEILVSLDDGDIDIETTGFDEIDLKSLVDHLNTGTALGRTPKEAKLIYENMMIKQIVFNFENREYEKIVKNLNSIMEKKKLKNHTEVFLLLLGTYENYQRKAKKD